MSRNKILLAFDGSENAQRMMEYVGNMFASVKDLEVTILGIHKKIPEQKLEGDHVGVAKLKESLHALELDREQGKEKIKRAAEILIREGFSPQNVHVKYVEQRHTIAKDIINEVREGGYGTVVVGRRGISNIRDFILGSVTSTLINNLQGHTVCVVE